MSALFGYFVPQSEENDTLDHNAIVEAMSRELVFDSAARHAAWKHDGLSIVQRSHGESAERCVPVRDREGTLTLFLDGEIFNHDASGKRENDIVTDQPGPYPQEAAYCLYLYRRFGEKCFERLNGSFLIVIHDHRNREIIIANDRVASRPLSTASGTGSSSSRRSPGP